MSTDGEYVRRVTDFRFGNSVAVASAEVIETPAEYPRVKECDQHAGQAPVGNVHLVRKLGSICIRADECIGADKSLGPSECA